MRMFEYKVVPAPRKGEKTKTAKTTAEKFGVALARVMNEQAAEGWEYLRADTLPCEERVGLTGTATHFQNMLVFRRALAQAVNGAGAHVSAEAPYVEAEEDDEADEGAYPAPAPAARPDAARTPSLGPATTSAPVVPFPQGRN